MVLSGGTSPNPPVLSRRRAGVLLPAASLPSGTLDSDVERWLEFLEACGFSVWQMLPLGPVGPNRSPYSSRSVFAAEESLVPPHLRRLPVDPYELDGFRSAREPWLSDYVRFSVIRKTQGGKPWWEWPVELRRRRSWEVASFARAHQPESRNAEAVQFHFERRWAEVRNVAHAAGILLYGDLPMFLVADSADVWAAPNLFRLDVKGLPTHVAGVPPDAFTRNGQCWDNPVYDWGEMQVEKFAWWVRRLELETRRFDLLRWDHFRGLIATWEIPATGKRQASRGQWREVPGRELLDTLFANVGLLPVIAENLGIITPEVEQLRRAKRLPGMHVLQFAFDGNLQNPHLPANHEEQGAAYTGTHDNDTSLGWYTSQTQEVQAQVRDLLKSDGVIDVPAGGGHASPGEVVRGMIRAVLKSPSRLAMVPLQDLLGLGSEARVNTPGKARGQWRWKFRWEDLTPELAESCREMVEESGRLVSKPHEI